MRKIEISKRRKNGKCEKVTDLPYVLYFLLVKPTNFLMTRYSHRQRTDSNFSNCKSPDKSKSVAQFFLPTVKMNGEIWNFALGVAPDLRRGIS